MHRCEQSGRSLPRAVHYLVELCSLFFKFSPSFLTKILSPCAVAKNPCAAYIFALHKFLLSPCDTQLTPSFSFIFYYVHMLETIRLFSHTLGSSFKTTFHLIIFLLDSRAFSRCEKKISRIKVALCKFEKKIFTFSFALEHSSPIEE